MITEDIVQKAFNDIIYPNLKSYVESNSIYEPLITKSKPQVTDRWPIVPVKLLPNTNVYNSLSYDEEIFNFGIEFDINAQEKTVDNKKISKRTVCEEVTSWIVKFFKENLKLTVYIEPNAISTDISVHRALVRVTGKIDTRYGLDKLVIYPK